MIPRPQTFQFAHLFLAHICALALALPYASAQAVKPDGGPDTTPPRRQASLKDSQIQRSADAEAAQNDEVVELSVFEVSANKRGYYQDTTMAGTRINSNIEDLGAAITIITTEQMDDFGMLDINDIFAFEVGTEGMNTFTDISIDSNGNVSDGNMDDPGSANRVRGLGSPNKTFGNFETSGRTPLDRILLDGVEITRGPSSIIAGLGNPAGTINSIPATPHLTRNRNRAQFRVDGNNGFRETLDVNRVLIRGKLAVRAQQMFAHQGFQRKPSGTDAELYNFMVKYQPFRRTAFNVAYSKYKISGNRANQITPADGITPWRERGEWTWDPEPTLRDEAGRYTEGAYYDRNGNRIASPGNTVTDGFRGMTQSSGRGSSLLFVDNNGNVQWMAPRGTATENAFDNAQSGKNYRMLASTPIVNLNLPQSTTYAHPVGVSDQSLYDWTSINIAATDWFYNTNDTFLARLSQTFIETAKHYLAVEAGWFREDATAYSKSLSGKAKKNQTSSFLGIDVNRNLYYISLSPDDPRYDPENPYKNPNYLRPYLAVNQDIVADMPLLNDTYRAQLAYKLDFRQDKGWTRWLGLHSLSAYYEYKQHESQRYNYRHAMTSDHEWLPAGTPRGTSSNTEASNQHLLWNQVSNTNTRNYTFYYIGDPIGQNVDYAPGTLNPGQYDYIWGNVATGLMRHEPAALGLAADLAGSGGVNNSLKIVKGMGAVLQSHLLRDGVVVTLGARHDEVFQKDGVGPQLNPDGKTFDFSWNSRWVDEWRRRSGTTHAQGVVIKPAAWIKPNAPIWLRALRQFSFFYNQSSSLDLNYDPAFDLAGEMIPNPQGKGKDYGFTVRLFDNRLIMKLNRYQVDTLYQRSSTNAAQRALALDIYETSYEDDELPEDLTSSRGFGLNKVATDWVMQTSQGENLSSEEVFERVAAIMNMTPERLRTLQYYRPRVTEVDEAVAKGFEFELNWMATDYLTLRFNASQTEAINTKVAPGLETYLEERLDFWKDLIDPVTKTYWWTTPYENVLTGEPGMTPQSWYDQVKESWDLAKQSEGMPKPTIAKYSMKLMANLRLSGLTNHRILKGVDFSLSATWASKIGIGNYGLDTGERNADGQIVHRLLDPTRPVWGESRVVLGIVAGYRTKNFAGKRIDARFQFGISDILEDGHLQPVRADSNGVSTVFRIVDPRQFNFTATFNF